MQRTSLILASGDLNHDRSFALKALGYNFQAKVNSDVVKDCAIHCSTSLTGSHGFPP
jgi:hypothetical protein